LTLLGRNEERLKETLEKIAPSQAQYFSVDLTDFAATEAVIKSAVQEQGVFSGIIHSAGISTTLPLRSLKAGKVTQLLNTNVTAAIELTRLCTKKANFSSDGGSILFLSSVMGVVGEAGKTAYSLTKGALLAGSKSLALELARRQIRVNCISPGVVETPMSKSAVYSQTEEARQAIEKMHPLGLGQPEDIAHACIYLLSDAARWVTGTNLIVDGGYTAH
jgi:NAD(P)-dependent dehydrogenase (short-subunit alcohol dehydrogenase family)